MKKILFTFAFLTFFFSNAQFNTDAPWMNSFKDEARKTKPTFKEIVDAFDIYWEGKDHTVKGSGYKPFKRWEAFWQNFVDTNGYLPTAQEMIESWESVNAFVNETQSTLIDNSNWQSLGPTSFVNQATNSANIGRVNVIVVHPSDPNHYYAGAPAGGIWESTDGGTTWTPLSDNLPQIGVSGIAVVEVGANTHIYIATGDDDAGDSYSIGVYKSTDGGATWNPTGNIPTGGGFNSLRMNDIYVHPNNSNILWVATDNGLYKTINGGTTWTQSLSGNIRDIKLRPVDPNNGNFDGTIYAVSSNDFYRSTDFGTTFSSLGVGNGISTSSNRLVIDVTPANRDVVYVLRANSSNGYGGLFKSTDLGANFTEGANTTDVFESNQSWYDMAMAVSDTNEDEVYTGVLNIWKTTNGGDSFTQINQWYSRNASYTHADIHFLRFFNNELLAGTDGGFFKTTNGGTTFTDLTVGMEISQFYRIDVSRLTSTRIVGGTQDNGGFGYDNQWRNYHGGDGMEGVIDPNNDNNYYGFMQFGQTLFYSSTAGQGSTSSYGMPSGESGNWITPLAFNSESELYAGYSHLYQFNGSGWNQISPSFGSNISRLEIDPNNSNNIYVAISNSLRKSTDKGVTFSNVQSFSSGISSIEVSNENSNIIYVTTSGFSGGVYKSIDGGNNFSNITGGLPFVTKNIIVHTPEDISNTLYLGTNIGVYKYDDNTNDWEPFLNNLPTTSVRDLAINIFDGKIVAGTYGRGVWISDLSTPAVALDDIRLNAITVPQINNSIICDNNVTPEVEVVNNGSATITSVDLTYDFNGGASNNYNWTGTILAGENQTILLPTANLNKGAYTLNVNATIINDEFASNNNSTKNFYVNEIGSTDENDFESTDNSDELLTFNQNSGSILWERGAPNGTNLNNTSSGVNAYATNLSGSYPNETLAYLITDCYDISAMADPEIRFDMAFQIELDWDLIYLQYSTDNGSSWQLLGSSTDPNWYNSSRIAGDGLGNNCYNCVGGQWTGTDLANAVMTEYSLDLNFLSSETNVLFRFVFQSDYAVNEEGVVIDDLFIGGTTLSNPDFEISNVVIYPNPSDSNFNIKFSQPTTFNYTVVDITGKVIIKQDNVSTINNSQKIDLSSFSTGLYLLNLEYEGVKTTKKLILN